MMNEDQYSLYRLSRWQLGKDIRLSGKRKAAAEGARSQSVAINARRPAKAAGAARMDCSMA
jgi:hypothetical protein